VQELLFERGITVPHTGWCTWTSRRRSARAQAERRVVPRGGEAQCGRVKEGERCTE
jgi:hypothetical protein